MLNQGILRELYDEGFSMKEISQKLGVSPHKVCYWMEKYSIPRRTRSEATYVKRNPNGDPFCIKTCLTKEEAELKGIGLGLYWGEGTKANPTSVRLSNTDVGLIKKFIEFLITIFGIDRNRLKFSLQVFDDMNPAAIEVYWQEKLNVEPEQFYRTTVTPSRGRGTYRTKTEHGVLTVYYHNKKLRDILVGQLSNQEHHSL